MKSNYLLTIFFILLIQTTYAIGIDTVRTIKIGGIKQSISIQGEKSDHPIVLYLHGGPGQAASSQKEKISSQLEEDFVVVHWDQRNSGKTLELNPSQARVTIDLMKKDAEEVLTYLLKEFEKEQLTIIAHSWGTLLGFHLAKKYPDRINTFIAVSPTINTCKSQKTALKRLRKHFNKKGNNKAVKQLSSIKIPHRNIEEMIIQYRWQSVYNGEEVTDEMVKQYMPFFLDWEKKWMPVYRALYDVDINKQLKEILCPIYFFVGKEDYTSNFKLTESYYKKIKAPLKKMIWFDTSHNIPFLEPDLFQKTILDIL